MSLAVGSMVRARGREWVVLPESTDDLFMLRPLGGTDEESTGILPALELVEAASFPLPKADETGDYRSCRLLRDAVRLGFRSSAGPLRSFARISVEPRPYQLVPLLMSLKLDPIRMLIADDVGIGKTIEACLVARELIDRGECNRLAVLCPPHLAEQWQMELKEKFHIDAELVLSSTAKRLEKNCGLGETLFDIYPHVVVSLDFIKTDDRRNEFLRCCPDLVIVDEAHTCAYGAVGRGVMQRHRLLEGLASNLNRHMILVTATPHSGNENAFRSLLALLEPDFANLPEDLSGRGNETVRRHVAAHLVQRRRADIRSYLGETDFPERAEAEETYHLSPDYKKLFDKVLRYARETVVDLEGAGHRQRVRWWSALALLRSLASSPAAAAATLRARASTADTSTIEEADELGRQTVMDQTSEDSEVVADFIPGSDIGEFAADESGNRKRLLEFAREAEVLRGPKDLKLKRAIELVKDFLKDGYKPILFCRFIPTAEYVADELRKVLKGVEVISITGLLPPAEREQRIEAMRDHDKRVLVCTDCLSEGINLQDLFDSVIHYDLSWNPTRHEQREGRVDRFGQPRSKVRVLMYYGTDNKIDGIVLDVLMRKHKTIRNTLGISVPVPVDTDKVIEAIFEGLLLREEAGPLSKGQTLIFDDMFKPEIKQMHIDWDAIAEREKKSRTVFAQESIKVDEVAHELEEIRSAIGAGVEVEKFMRNATLAHGGFIGEKDPLTFLLDGTPQGLRDRIGIQKEFKARFSLPVPDGVQYLSRTHPIVEGMASFILETAQDSETKSVARRAGVIRTHLVGKRTTLLLALFRYHIFRKTDQGESPLLAEDCQLLAFEGAPANAVWLNPERAEELMMAEPDTNVPPDIASHALSRILEGFDSIRPHLEEAARQRGDQLRLAHTRVRQASRMKGVTYRVEPKLPPDILGVYVFLPGGQD